MKAANHLNQIKSVIKKPSLSGRLTGPDDKNHQASFCNFFFLAARYLSSNINPSTTLIIIKTFT